MSYVKRIYQKLHVHSKTEALYEARRLGLIVDSLSSVTDGWQP